MGTMVPVLFKHHHAAMSGLSTRAIAYDWIRVDPLTILIKWQTSLLNFANYVKFQNFFTHDKRQIVDLKKDEAAFHICIKYFCLL